MEIQASSLCEYGNQEIIGLLENQRNTTVTKLDLLKDIWEKALQSDPTLSVLKISRKSHDIPSSCYVLKGKGPGDLIFLQQYHASLPNRPKILPKDESEYYKGKIGSGAFNVVYGLRGLGGSPDYVRSVSRDESDISPTILAFCRVFKDAPHLALGPVMAHKGKEIRFSPLMKKGSLEDAIAGKNGVKFFELQPDQRIKIFLDISRALQILHNKGWAHYDVKPGNIVLDDKLSAYLIDFDLVGYSNSFARLSDVSGLIDAIVRMYETASLQPPEEITDLRLRCSDCASCNFPKIDEVISVLEKLL